MLDSKETGSIKMKDIIKKTAVSMITATMLLSAAACGNQAAPAGETTLAAGQAVQQSTASTSVDFSQYEFSSMYGSQLINYLDHQYYFNGQAIPLAESNFYFIEALKDLTNMASYGAFPMTSEGWIDLSAEVNGEIPGGTEGRIYANYGEFFVEYAEGMLENAYVVNALAEQDGLTLPEETVTLINDTISIDFANAAAQGGYSLDQYLKLFYGESCDEATMQGIMYRYKLADLYTTTYCENYEFDEDEIMVPNIRYALFYAPDGTSEEDMAAQEELATALLESSVDGEGNPDLEQFELRGILSERNGECYQYGEIPVELGQTASAFEEWAYGEDREEGDIDMIYAPEFGYFVVGYLGLTEIEQSSKDQIAFAALADYIKEIIDSDTYEFYGEGEFVTPDPVVPSPTDPSTGEPVAPSNAASQDPAKKIDPKELAVTILAGIGGIAVVGGIFYGIASLVKKGGAGKAAKPDDDGDAFDKISDAESSGDDHDHIEDEDTDDNED